VPPDVGNYPLDLLERPCRGVGTIRWIAAFLVEAFVRHNLLTALLADSLLALGVLLFASIASSGLNRSR
jgi:hypothetical protein